MTQCEGVLAKNDAITSLASSTRALQVFAALGHAYNEDWSSRFGAVVTDMLAQEKPEHKTKVKFKIYQVLFEVVRGFTK